MPKGAASPPTEGLIKDQKHMKKNKFGSQSKELNLVESVAQEGYSGDWQQAIEIKVQIARENLKIKR